MENKEVMMNEEVMENGQVETTEKRSIASRVGGFIKKAIKPALAFAAGAVIVLVVGKLSGKNESEVIDGVDYTEIDHTDVSGETV